MHPGGEEGLAWRVTTLLPLDISTCDGTQLGRLCPHWGNPQEQGLPAGV